jgi:hypothetical protein
MNPSHHRRPWSPDPYDPYLTIHHDYRRQPSDASIEALDLADYARTLTRTADRDFATHRYPLPFNRPPPPPPSLTSDRRTNSSRSHQTHSSPVRRPYSVPPRTSTPPRLEAFPPVPKPDEEIDVSQFPPWSRNWYTRPKIFNTPYPVPDPEELDLVVSSSSHANPWDPTYTHPDSIHHHHPLSYLHDHPSSNHPSNTLLPWSADPADSGPPLDAEVKEERVRMLEREFGGARKGPNIAPTTLPIGTVDEKGKLVTEGPKKRAFFRFIQVFLALGAAVPSIYVALVRHHLFLPLKTPTISYIPQIVKPIRGLPPPASKAPAYALYILSVLTSFLLLFLFLIHPCCIARGRSSDSDGAGGGLLPGGLAVLPVGTAGGGGGGAGSQPKKKGGGKGRPPGGGDVQVNLIVDPALFDREREYEEEEADEYDDSDAYTLPSSSSRRRQRRRLPPRPARRSIFIALAQENQWREARSWRKKLMFVDVCGVLLWGGLFVFILLGKRCPSGQYQGW